MRVVSALVLGCLLLAATPVSGSFRNIDHLMLYYTDGTFVHDAVSSGYYSIDMGNWNVKAVLKTTGTDPRSMRFRFIVFTGTGWISDRGARWSNYKCLSRSANTRETYTKPDGSSGTRRYHWATGSQGTALQYLKTKQNLLYMRFQPKKNTNCRSSSGQEYRLNLVVWDPAERLAQQGGTLAPSPTVASRSFAAVCGVEAMLLEMVGTQWYRQKPIDVWARDYDTVTFAVSQDWIDNILCAASTEYRQTDGSMTCPRIINKRPGEMASYTAKCEADGFADITVYAHDVEFDLDKDRAYWPSYCTPVEAGKAVSYKFKIPCATNDIEVCEPEGFVTCAADGLDIPMVREDYETSTEVSNWRVNWDGVVSDTVGGSTCVKLGYKRYEMSRTLVLSQSINAVLIEFEMRKIGSWSSSDRLYLRMGNYHNLQLSNVHSLSGSIVYTFGNMIVQLTKSGSTTILVSIYVPSGQWIPSNGRVVFGVWAKFGGGKFVCIDNFLTTAVCGELDAPTAPTAPAPIPISSATTCEDAESMPIRGITASPNQAWPTMDGQISTDEYAGSTVFQIYQDSLSSGDVLMDVSILVDCDNEYWYVKVELVGDLCSSLAWINGREHYVKFNGNKRIDGKASADKFRKLVDENNVFYGWEAKIGYGCRRNTAPQNFKIGTRAVRQDDLTSSVAAGTLGQQTKVCLICGLPSTPVPSALPTNIAGVTNIGMANYCPSGQLVKGALPGQFSPPTIDGDLAGTEWNGPMVTVMEMHKAHREDKEVLSFLKIMVNCGTDEWYMRMEINPEEGSEYVLDDNQNTVKMARADGNLGGTIPWTQFAFIVDGSNTRVGWEGKFTWTGTGGAPEKMKVHSNIFQQGESQTSATINNLPGNGNPQGIGICVCGNGVIQVPTATTSAPFMAPTAGQCPSPGREYRVYGRSTSADVW